MCLVNTSRNYVEKVRIQEPEEKEQLVIFLCRVSGQLNVAVSFEGTEQG
jgi:hypothetical protein